MNILITGAGGFVGRNLTAALQCKVDSISCIKLTLKESSLSSRDTDRYGYGHAVTNSCVTNRVKNFKSILNTVIKILRIEEHDVLIIIVGFDNTIHGCRPILELFFDAYNRIGKLLMNVLKNVLDVIDSNVCHGNTLVVVLLFKNLKLGYVGEHREVEAVILL